MLTLEVKKKRVFSLFIDVALLGVVFCVSCIRFFMSLLVFDHHQTLAIRRHEPAIDQR